MAALSNGRLSERTGPASSLRHMPGTSKSWYRPMLIITPRNSIHRHLIIGEDRYRPPMDSGKRLKRRM